jgi:hypothetical protein
VAWHGERGGHRRRFVRRPAASSSPHLPGTTSPRHIYYFRILWLRVDCLAGERCGVAGVAWGARWSSLSIPWFAGRRRVVGSEGIIVIDLFVRRAADELLCACTTSPPAGVSLIFGCMCIVLAGERRAGSWIRERWGSSTPAGRRGQSRPCCPALCD